MTKKKRITGDSIQAMLMLAPMMIGFIVFTYVPIVLILRYAMYQSNGFREQWIGFENFIRLFTRDTQYWRFVLNTLVLSFGKLLVEIPLALLLAVLMNKGLKATGFYRVTLFLPAIISTAITGLIFSLMFAAFNGIVNGMLMRIGLIAKPVNWFGRQATAMMVLGLASVWNNYGINMIFFLMALQSVPKELYECADIDGITPWKKFLYITMPMIGPTFQAVLLMAIVGSLKVADLILASTNGQPSGGTEVVMTYVFKYFFGYDGRTIEVGYASSMAVVTGILLAIVSFVYIRSTNKLGHSTE
ncbi:MAG: sugar ABC transporter permease [Lachnospiraceae bacterium]|jgi:ABC-type sugar transport system permease subunit|nr:sugar ABC transporter permease [Lachnospiraceae bacterium]